jgi:NAD(P)-dependent dehydrogenase (short-subunit alcohol dehydrogenase family)
MGVKALFDLSGRVALVTGGSRGLGLQIAEGLGEMGAKVALVARNGAVLDQAAAHLRSLGIEAVPIACDLAKPEAVAPMVAQAIEALGPIDILVNNAGATWGAATVDHPLEAWRKVVDLNLTAMFLACQEAGRRCMLARRSGKIVNIASISGLIGNADAARPATLAYNTTKGGVLAFTRALAAEWAPFNVNVNAIAPGLFPTKMTHGLIGILGEDKAMARAPLHRLGGPEDLKGAALLLASDAGAYITGQVIVVDGGVTAV